MKLDPGFVNHWKTELLLNELGADGLLALLRLWSSAQIRRKWRNLALNPQRLAMETKWKANADHLWQVFTDPAAPWLDPEDDGTWAIHGFEEQQKQVIHLWAAGSKGGRRKPSEENKKEEYSSSSSYPICLPNGKHLEEKLDSTRDKKRFASFEEVQTFAQGQPFPITPDCQEAFFDRMEEIGWTDDRGLPLADWRARFRRFATNWHNNRHGAANAPRIHPNAKKA